MQPNLSHPSTVVLRAARPVTTVCCCPEQPNLSKRLLLSREQPHLSQPSTVVLRAAKPLTTSTVALRAATTSTVVLRAAKHLTSVYCCPVGSQTCHIRPVPWLHASSGSLNCHSRLLLSLGQPNLSHLPQQSLHQHNLPLLVHRLRPFG